MKPEAKRDRRQGRRSPQTDLAQSAFVQMELVGFGKFLTCNRAANDLDDDDDDDDGGGGGGGDDDGGDDDSVTG